MLYKQIKALYERSRLEHYRELFGRIREKDGSLSATEAYAADVIYLLQNPTVSTFAEVLGISQPNATYQQPGRQGLRHPHLFGHRPPGVPYFRCGQVFLLLQYGLPLPLQGDRRAARKIHARAACPLRKNPGRSDRLIGIIFSKKH